MALVGVRGDPVGDELVMAGAKGPNQRRGEAAVSAETGSSAAVLISHNNVASADAHARCEATVATSNSAEAWLS